ncbi:MULTISPECIES: hypothetical protein [unclassified Streptomyces]|uniref:hypothetical protein n=1 Tax=unclassified Streptomyces TaxID=2593676 RepID=UPI0036E235C6
MTLQLSRPQSFQVKATWWKAEGAAQLIDALVATMRLVPVDADGNEVELGAGG